MTGRTFAWCVAAMALSTPALAQTQTQPQARTQDATSAAAIRQRYSEVRQQNRGLKLGAMERQRFAVDRKKVEELIERAEAGQIVTTEEVDRALGLTR